MASTPTFGSELTPASGHESAPKLVRTAGIGSDVTPESGHESAPKLVQRPSFQEIILRLQNFWDRQGCALLQPYDMEVGAGTSHTATFLRAIGP